MSCLSQGRHPICQSLCTRAQCTLFQRAMRHKLASPKRTLSLSHSHSICAGRCSATSNSLSIAQCAAQTCFPFSRFPFCSSFEHPIFRTCICAGWQKAKSAKYGCNHETCIKDYCKHGECALIVRTTTAVTQHQRCCKQN